MMPLVGTHVGHRRTHRASVNVRLRQLVKSKLHKERRWSTIRSASLFTAILMGYVGFVLVFWIVGR